MMTIRVVVSMLWNYRLESPAKAVRRGLPRKGRGGKDADLSPPEFLAQAPLLSHHAP